MTDARKKKALAKLGWVCRQIEDELAGQDVTLRDVLLPHERKPGETDLERLQRFKALLNECLGQLARGEARRCIRCEAPLPAEVLDEMPWAFACRGCGS